MNEIKRCPFCGWEFAEHAWNEFGEEYRVCDQCGASSGTVDSKWDWQSRPIEDALNARIIEVTHLYSQTKDAFNLVTEVLLKQDARIAELEAEVTKCHELQDSYCDRIAELEAAQRWIRTKVKLPDRAVRQFYEVVCLHQDFAELALFSKGRWIIYEGTSVYDITDRVVFWRRRQPLPAEVMDVLNKRQELQ